MKRIVFLIAFCLSLSTIYAQTTDVIHLKNGFDARGTITNRTESQITLQSENGRILTIDMSEIESMEQEQKAFDPRVLIGRWACYKASGERDERYDMEISEHEGFFTVSYIKLLLYNSKDDKVGAFPFVTPDITAKAHEDIEINDGSFSYYFFNVESAFVYLNTRKEHEFRNQRFSCNIDLKYIDGKLKGSIDCLNYFHAMGDSNYGSIADALEHGRGTLFADGPGGKWNVYFVKY